MNRFDAELAGELDALRAAGLYRELRRVASPAARRIELAAGSLLNFSSNDYLGLADEPALKEAARRATAEFGAGSTASRLICGSLAPHHELDEAVAAFKGTEAALAFGSGYATALGTIPALVGRDDVIVLDKLVHACVIDAARLSGARLRVFAHNDLDELESILRWADTRKPAATEARRPRVLIVTESVFSMDGDHAPLPPMVELKDRFGAWLMVDEAHATGIYGPRRRGLAEALEVAGRIEIQMGTLGKAVGAAGGYIAGSRTLVDFLVNRARSFIFSTAPVPGAAAAATAGIRFIQGKAGVQRCAQLWANVRRVTTARPELPADSAILPLIVGAEAGAVAASAALRRRGLFIPAVRYPTVPRGAARLRLTLSAAHTPDDLTQLLAALESVNLRTSAL
ncbi:MAG: 8-amino-7-oxononanoate synthase [Verrucomicrobiota bacterium]